MTCSAIPSAPQYQRSSGRKRVTAIKRTVISRDIPYRLAQQVPHKAADHAVRIFPGRAQCRYGMRGPWVV